MKKSIYSCTLIPDGDRRVIENKYHKSDEPFDAFHHRKYHGYDYDPSTGLDDGEIAAGLEKLASQLAGEHHYVIKSRLFSYVLENTRIDVNEHDYFVGMYTWDRLIDRHTVDPWQWEVHEKLEREKGTCQFQYTGASWAGLDYDHTVPDWDSLAELGFVGVLDRLERSYAAAGKSSALTEKQELFYLGAVTEYRALIGFVNRLYEYSLTKSFSKAALISESLKHLLEGAPQTTHDMLQLIYIYFMVSESVEHYQVRSLGHGLDSTLYPFFRRDLESGRFTKEDIARFLAYFFMQFSAMGNYYGQPFYLGGTGADGSTAVNELSYLILDVYDFLGIYSPKIQIKVCRHTPRDFVCRAMEMIIGGTNSIVFCNEDIMIKSLMRAGATYEKAVRGVVKGCYEYALRAESMGISFNFFNALKPVHYVFSRGYDAIKKQRIGLDTGDVTAFRTFDEFYNAYLAQFHYIIEENSAYIYELEKYVNDINPSLLYAATVPRCVDTLTDANDGGISNVSDMLLNGLASAVDALMAVYELVFETHATTLAELKDALDKNWEGYETLRARALNAKHKYGREDAISDYYANALHSFFASHFAGRRNSHGGNVEYELHSALNFISHGKKIPATPDGRLDGEEVSKNASPVMGMDKNGITALIHSATALDFTLSDSGACLDCMLHPSTVQGEDGKDVLYAILETYLSRGGASIHFNVFSPETLKDAQKHPERYKSLQVRVCGWNVLWNNLSRAEQDAYIRRAEGISH